jgi:hypothetical protein
VRLRGCVCSTGGDFWRRPISFFATQIDEVVDFVEGKELGCKCFSRVWPCLTSLHTATCGMVFFNDFQNYYWIKI